MAQASILSVGSLNMDQVVQIARLPVPGETLLGGGSLHLIPGGKGANQAVAMARLGATVTMAGRVGRDPFGTSLLQALQADHIDTSLVVVDEQEASGVAFIFLTPSGENAIVVASGANMRVGEDQEQLNQILAALPDSRALVLQLEIPLKTVTRLVAAGHETGIPVILNLAPARELPLETLRQLAVLIVNETEAGFLHARLQGSSTSASSVIQNREEACSLATALHNQGIANVIITLGAQGAVLARTDEASHTHCIVQTPPAVRVVDTTAAGDCFAGAFTVALSEGQSPEEALRFAVYASALKVTRFGAQSGLPTRSEVSELLHQNAPEN